MNFNIYLDENLAHQVDDYVEKNGVSRSYLIRAALKSWLQKHNNSEWGEGFFSFTPEDFPSALKLRSDIGNPKEDPLS